jgi:hypothetical protein
MVNASGREETTFEERKGRGVSTIKHLWPNQPQMNRIIMWDFDPDWYIWR